MPDESLSSDPATSAECPWCSATLPPDATTTCPSCGAGLKATAVEDVPGVTAVDVAILSKNRQAPPKQRSRLLSWISGDVADDPLTNAEVKAIAPPDEEVRREILRLELEAHVANLQAEAGSRLSDAVEEGRAVDIPPGLREYAPDELVAAVEPAGGAAAVEPDPTTEAETQAAATTADATDAVDTATDAHAVEATAAADPGPAAAEGDAAG